MLDKFKGFFRARDGERVLVPNRTINLPRTKAEHTVTKTGSGASAVRIKPTKVKPIEEKTCFKTPVNLSAKEEKKDSHTKSRLLRMPSFFVEQREVSVVRPSGPVTATLSEGKKKSPPPATPSVAATPKPKKWRRDVDASKTSEATASHHVRPMFLAASIALVFFAMIVGTAAASSHMVAYEVFLDDTKIGLVAAKDDFNKVFDEVRADLAKCAEQGAVKEKQPVFNQVLASKDGFTNRNTLRANILGRYDGIVEAYTIVVDDTPMTSHPTKEATSTVLEELKQPYAQDEGIISLDFDKKVKIIKEFVPIPKLVGVDDAVTYYSGKKDVQQKYQVQEGENWWTIARSHSMTMEQLMALNPTSPELLQIGQELSISVPTAVLGVRVIAKKVYEKELPFENKTVNDGELAKGTTTVQQQGEKGKQKITAQVTTVNGMEVEKTVLSEETLALPKDHIVKVGTKEPESSTVSVASRSSSENRSASSSSSSSSSAKQSSSESSSSSSSSGNGVTRGSGSFIRPTTGTYTSRYGYRGREFHTGLDIANSIGTPVVAADGGIVTGSGWRGNYGYCVTIDHGNGYQTLYAHNSSLSVRVGQRVSKGQRIASMGSTGRSTGSHCHFEIIRNGSTVNPANYI